MRLVLSCLLLASLVGCNSGSSGGGSNPGSNYGAVNSNRKLQSINENPDYNYNIMIAQAYPGNSSFAELESCKYSSITMNECINDDYVYRDTDFYSVVTTSYGTLYAGTSTGKIIHMTNPLDKNYKGLKTTTYMDGKKVDRLLFNEESGVLIAASNDDEVIKAYNADLSDSVQIGLPASGSKLVEMFNAVIDNKKVFMFIFTSDAGGYVAWISPDELFQNGKVIESVRHVNTPAHYIPTPNGMLWVESSIHNIKEPAGFRSLQHYYMTGILPGKYAISADGTSVYLATNDKLYKRDLSNLSTFHMKTSFVELADISDLPLIDWVDPHLKPKPDLMYKNIGKMLDDGSSLWMGVKGELYQCTKAHIQSNLPYCAKVDGMTFQNPITSILYDHQSEQLFVASMAEGGALRVLDTLTNKVLKILDNKTHGIYDLAILREPYSYPDFLSLHDFYRITKEFTENVFNAAMKQQLIDGKNEIIHTRRNNTLPLASQDVVSEKMNFVSDLPRYAESSESQISNSDLPLLPKITSPETPDLISIIKEPTSTFTKCKNIVTSSTVTNYSDFNQTMSTPNVTLTLTNSTQNTFSWNIGGKISNALTMKTDIFVAGAEDTVTIETSAGSSWSDVKSNSNSYSYTLPTQNVLVPPHSSIYVKSCIDQEMNANGLFKVQYPYAANSYATGHALINGANTRIFVDVVKLGLAYNRYCVAHPNDIDCSLSQNKDLGKRIQIIDNNVTVIGETRYDNVKMTVGNFSIESVK